MGNLQVDSANQRVEQLIEQNKSGNELRMFVCSNIDEIFDVNIIMEQLQKEEKKIYWDSIAEKIVINQLIEQNKSGNELRMFVCSNIDEIFDVNIIMEQVQKEEKKKYWDSLAEKIIINYPIFYKLLCILKINKIYAKIMGR